jgi:hypothetical protein
LLRPGGEGSGTVGIIHAGVAQQCLDRGFERRQVVLDHAPDDGMLEAVVAVAQDVADAGDVAAGDLGVRGFEIVRQVARRFRDDFDASLGGKPQPPLA